SHATSPKPFAVKTHRKAARSAPVLRVCTGDKPDRFQTAPSRHLERPENIGIAGLRNHFLSKLFVPPETKNQASINFSNGNGFCVVRENFYMHTRNKRLVPGVGAMDFAENAKLRSFNGIPKWSCRAPGSGLSDIAIKRGVG